MTLTSPVDCAPPPLHTATAACLILRVPHWFARADFQDWRQGRAPGQWCAPACWLPGRRHGDYTDAFTTFEADDNLPGAWTGSDADGLHDDIFHAIGTSLRQQRFPGSRDRVRPRGRHAACCGSISRCDPAHTGASGGSPSARYRIAARRTSAFVVASTPFWYWNIKSLGYPKYS